MWVIELNEERRRKERRDGLLGPPFQANQWEPKRHPLFEESCSWGSYCPFVCCIWCVDVSCGWDLKRIVDNLNWHILIRVIGTWSLREDIFNKPQQICCWVRNFFFILCFTIWQCSKSDSACCAFGSRQPSYLWKWMYRACKGKQNWLSFVDCKQQLDLQESHKF